uniref:SCP domain-containing protein n=1 Tax=Mesocestoides corti TaxID=53468 RepID=A0A5K3FN16_MESCO
YSDEVEKLAKEFVEKCPGVQDVPQFQNVGYVAPILYSQNNQYNKSFCQIKMPKSGFNCSLSDPACRFYKQMVWANSTHVGCAAKQCPNKTRYFPNTYVMVCLYQPGQHDLNSTPYLIGTPCSNCTKPYRCERNQCAPATASTSITIASMTTTSVSPFLVKNNPAPRALVPQT